MHFDDTRCNLKIPQNFSKVTRRYLTVTRRYLTLLDVTRRYSTLLDGTRRFPTFLDGALRLPPVTRRLSTVFLSYCTLLIVSYMCPLLFSISTKFVLSHCRS